MARPAGQVIVRMDVERIMETSGRAWDRAAARVAMELDEKIQREITKRQSPPPSKTGQYPHIGARFDHPKLFESYTVTGTRQGLKVYCTVPHGLYLNEGTSRMAKRPWATRAITYRDWAARIAQLARQETGGSRRRSK